MKRRTRHRHFFTRVFNLVIMPKEEESGKWKEERGKGKEKRQ